MNFKKEAALWIIIYLFVVLNIQVFGKEIGCSFIEVPAVAVSGKSVMTTIKVEILEGKGRILLDTSPLIGIQTQNSERIAVKVAEQYTGINFSNYDVIFTFKTTAQTIEGPSAGAAMAIAVIAAIENKTIRNDVSISATIYPDGSVGSVGALVDKAKAVALSGKKIFLIPKGESLQPIVVTKVEKPMEGWTIINKRVEYINLTTYAKERWNLTIVEVSNIKDIISILIEGKNKTITKLNVEKVKIEKATPLLPSKKMQTFAKIEIENAEKEINYAMEIFENITPLASDDVLLTIIENSKKDLEKAKFAFNNNYWYGAANYAFHAIINARFVRDVLLYNNLNDFEKVKFLGDRLTEISLKFENTKLKFENITSLVNDKGSFEWAIAAQQRFTQAKLQLDERPNETSSIFFNIAVAEEWLNVANNFLEVAKEMKTNEIFISYEFKEISNFALNKAKAEIEFFGGEKQYGANWYYRVAKDEYERGNYLTSYIDANIAIIRAETNKEFNMRNLSGIVNEIEKEIKEANYTSSVWAVLYLDYAKLSLYYAKKDKKISQLKESIIYLRQASLWNEVYKKVVSLPSIEKKEKNSVNFETNSNFNFLLLCILSLIIFSTFLSKKRKKKKRFKFLLFLLNHPLCLHVPK